MLKSVSFAFRFCFVCLFFFSFYFLPIFFPHDVLVNFFCRFTFAIFELVIVSFSTGSHDACRGTLGCNLYFAITGALTNVAYCQCIFFQTKAAAEFIEISRMLVEIDRITVLNYDIS